MDLSKVNWSNNTTGQIVRDWDINTMNLIKILNFEEGFRSTPYICDLGYVTIGLGTKLHNSLHMNPKDFPIMVSRRIAEEWLHAEVDIKNARLNNPLFNKYSRTYKMLDEDTRAVILSMAYQMGVSGVLKFDKMWKALSIEDREVAAREALDSLWARQTPERAARHARVISGEPLEKVYSEL